MAGVSGNRAFVQPLGITVSFCKEEGQENKVSDGPEGVEQADREGQLPPHKHPGDPA